MKVCMLVYNNFKNDSRVLKEAIALKQAGYTLTVIAVLSKDLPPFEEKNGIKIIRVERKAFHFVIIKQIKRIQFSHVFKSILSHVKLSRRHKNLSTFYSERFLNVSRLAVKSASYMSFLLIPLCYICFKLKKVMSSLYGLMYSIVYEIVLSIHQPYSLLDYFYHAFQAAKDDPAHIYHGHDLSTLPLAYWLARSFKAKFIYDSHEFFLERNTKRKISFIEKSTLYLLEGFLMHKADASITVNDSISNALSVRYRVPKPIVIMNIPAKPKPNQTLDGKNLREILGINSQYSILLYSGMRTFNRGIEKLIESLLYLPSSHLVLMGYGNPNYDSSLHSLIDDFQLSDRVSFFGPVETDEVIMYASSADLGVAPIENSCLSYYYCSPNKLFEYILAGLPVIASDFPEMSNIILNYDIGYTFDPSSSQDIAKAAKKAVDRFSTFNIPETIKTEIMTEYNWENESSKLIRLYQQVCSIC